MLIVNLIQVFGGLAILLLGIDMLSTGMEALAGTRIQTWLERMTDHPLKAASFGFVATSVLQSSSLLMVTMIGLINAHLLTLEQAVGVMMGQEIGTTLTGQLVASDIGKYVFVLPIVGYALYGFGVEKRRRALGQALLGIGLLFLSLETMKMGIRPLTEQPWTQSWLAAMGQTPLLGLLSNMVLTAVIQSSSATTSLTIALGAAGAITLRGAIAMILGANMGTCVTGLLASLHSRKAARQASVAQIIINLFGVALFFPFITPFAQFLARISSSPGRQIANAHTIFNVIVSLILFPFIAVIVRVSKMLVPGEEKAPASITKFLDERLLSVPAIALPQAAKEVVRTGRLTSDMLTWSQAALLQMDQAAIQRVLDCENEQIDGLCKVIEDFIDRLMRGHLSEAERRRCFQLKHLITDIERVADLAENLAQAGQERAREQIPFSPQAQEELLQFHSQVSRVWAWAVDALESGDKTIARAVVDGEDEIDMMEKRLRESHRKRQECGICAPKADILFIETLRNLERIGDHADNLGVSVLRN